MELGPILRALKQNKTGPALICLQTALTLAVVVNAMHLINTRLEKMDRPLGIDVDNILNVSSIPITPVDDPEGYVRRDLQAIRAIPGVAAASPVLTFLQSGSARAEGYRAQPEQRDDLDRLVNVNYADEQGLEAFGIELVKGRYFRADEIIYLGPDERAMPTVAVITETLGRVLFGDEEPLGKEIYYSEQNRSMRVIGIIEDVAVAWIASDSEFARDSTYNFMLQPFVESRRGRGHNYVVRTEPGLALQLIPQIEKTLLDLHHDRLMSPIRTQGEIIERSYGTDRAITQILSTVALLMILVTGFGIVGLASFTVNQRKRQIGTRRALGARRGDILRHFLTENLMLTTFGVAVGAVLTYGLHLFLFDLLPVPRMPFTFLVSGIGLLYLLGLLAVCGPAHRASMIPPGIATRTV